MKKDLFLQEIFSKGIGFCQNKEQCRGNKITIIGFINTE